MSNSRNVLILSVVAAALVGFIAGQSLGLRQGANLSAVSDIEQRLAVVGFTQSVISAMSEGGPEHANAVANLWIDGELVAIDGIYDQLDENQQGLFQRTVERIARHRQEFPTGQRQSAETNAVLRRFAD